MAIHAQQSYVTGAINALNTDAIEEGSLNLYFTNSRAISATSSAITSASAAAVVSANSYTDSAVSGLIDSAPGALDTLNELAAALGDDANFATTVTNSLATKLDVSTASATYLTGNQTVTLSGDATGSGSTSISLTLANTAVTPSSYGSASVVPTFTVDSKGRLTAASNTTIAIAQSAVANLTTDLGLKANLASPSLTGVPISPTAAVDTNTTQIATTAFVLGQSSNANPIALGSVAQGTSKRYARQDHVHPTTGLGLTSGTLAQFAATTSDQLRGVISNETGTGSLVFATSPTLTTPNIGVATGTSFNSITALSSTSPLMDGAVAVGTGTTVARADHRHPVDTSRAPLASPTFTGIPIAPTATAGTSTTQIATTEYVQGELGGVQPTIHPMFIIGGV